MSGVDGVSSGEAGAALGVADVTWRVHATHIATLSRPSIVGAKA